MKRSVHSSPAKELWTTQGGQQQLAAAQEEEQLPLCRPGPRSWKVKMKKAKEERDFANVDDLLMSGSDSDQENMDEIADDKVGAVVESSNPAVAGDEPAAEDSDDDMETYVSGDSNLVEKASVATAAAVTIKTTLPVSVASESAPAVSEAKCLASPAVSVSTAGDIDTSAGNDEETTWAEKALEATPMVAESGASSGGGTANRSRRLGGAAGRPERAECGVCGQIVPQASLESHQSMVHTFPCPAESCGKRFILQRTMERHIKQVHAPQAEQVISLPPRLAQSIKQLQPEAELAAIFEESAKHVPKPVEVLQEEQKDGEEEVRDKDKENREIDEDNEDACHGTTAQVQEDTKDSKMEEEEEKNNLKEVEETKTVLEKDEEVDTSIDPEVGPFICKYCREEFKTWAILTRHFVTPHLFTCSLCELAFNRQTTLEDHVNAVHDLVGQIQATSCGLCGESFSRASALVRHTRAPHNFGCRKCPARFMAKVHLTRHTPACPNKHLPDREMPTPRQGGGRSRGGRRGRGRVGRRGTAARYRNNMEEEQESENSNQEEIEHKKRNLNDESEDDFQETSDMESEEEEVVKSRSRSKSASKKGGGRKKQRRGKKEGSTADEDETDEEEKETKRHNRKKQSGAKKRATRTPEEESRSDESMERDETDGEDIEEEKKNMEVKVKKGFRANRQKEEDDQDNGEAVEVSGDDSEPAEGRARRKRRLSFSDVDGGSELTGKRGRRGGRQRGKKNTEEPEKDLDQSAAESLEGESPDENLSLYARRKKAPSSSKKKKQQTSKGGGPENEVEEGKSAKKQQPEQVICALCDGAFARVSFKNHQAREHRFACASCDKRFVAKAKLNMHMQEHHANNTTGGDLYAGGSVGPAAGEVFECEHCGFRIEAATKATLKVFRKNIEVHRGTPHRFPCQRCGKVFISADRVQLHAHRMHGEPLPPVLTCSCCDAPFNESDSEVRMHRFVEHCLAIHKHGCGDCDKSFVLLKELKIHRVDVHGAGKKKSKHWVETDSSSSSNEEESIGVKKKEEEEEKDEESADRDDGKEYVCGMCGAVVVGAHLFRQHSDLSHPHDCCECELHFASQERLRHHSFHCHGESLGGDVVSTHCGRCRLDLPDVAAFLDHVELPHRHACDLCVLVFPDLLSHERHVELDHPEPPRVCVECNSTFRREKGEEDNSAYEDHIGTVHRHACVVCPRKFVKRYQLNRHLQAEHEDDDIQCRLCHDEFGDWQLLTNHMEESHEHGCDHCALRFVSSTAKEKHGLDVHGVVRGLDLRCGQCRAEFADTAQFREHFKVPHRVNCGRCELKFPSEDLLAVHTAAVHSSARKSAGSGGVATAAAGGGDKKLSCELCGKQFGWKEKNLLREHEALPHQYSCEECPLRFAKSARLRDHIGSAHTGRSRAMDEKFTCRMCGTVCNKRNDMKLSKEALDHHVSLPHKLPCRNCSFRFTNKSKLEQHIAEVHAVGSSAASASAGTNQNECEICGHRLPDPDLLRRHRQKPHTIVCKERTCRRRFCTVASLEKHLQRKHTDFAGARLSEEGHVRFPCRLCGVVFEHHLGLQSHQHVDHQMKCHLCTMRFVHEPDLANHLKEQHQVDRILRSGFTCSQCNTRHERMLDMRKHGALHHKFSCSYCRLRYPVKSQLDAHMEENHMNNVMMDVLQAGGGSAHQLQEEEQLMERSADQAKLGVNLLLFAGSRMVKEHLQKIMSGKLDSKRHKLFMDPSERKQCLSSGDSQLYRLSCPRYLALPPPTDQALIEILLEVVKANKSVIPGPSPGWEYVICVLLPELWVFYLTRLKGLSKVQAEEKISREMEPSAVREEWRDLDKQISIWKARFEPDRKTGANAAAADGDIQILNLKSRPTTTTPSPADPRKKSGSSDKLVVTGKEATADPRQWRKERQPAASPVACSDTMSADPRRRSVSSAVSPGTPVGVSIPGSNQLEGGGASSDPRRRPYNSGTASGTAAMVSASDPRRRRPSNGSAAEKPTNVSSFDTFESGGGLLVPVTVQCSNVTGTLPTAPSLTTASVDPRRRSTAPAHLDSEGNTTDAVRQPEEAPQLDADDQRYGEAADMGTESSRSAAAGQETEKQPGMTRKKTPPPNYLEDIQHWSSSSDPARPQQQASAAGVAGPWKQASRTGESHPNLWAAAASAAPANFSVPPPQLVLSRPPPLPAQQHEPYYHSGISNSDWHGPPQLHHHRGGGGAAAGGGRGGFHPQPNEWRGGGGYEYRGRGGPPPHPRGGNRRGGRGHFHDQQHRGSWRGNDHHGRGSWRGTGTGNDPYPNPRGRRGGRGGSDQSCWGGDDHRQRLLSSDDHTWGRDDRHQRGLSLDDHQRHRSPRRDEIGDSRGSGRASWRQADRGDRRSKEGDDRHRYDSRERQSWGRNSEDRSSGDRRGRRGESEDDREQKRDRHYHRRRRTSSPDRHEHRNRSPNSEEHRYRRSSRDNNRDPMEASFDRRSPPRPRSRSPISRYGDRERSSPQERGWEHNSGGHSEMAESEHHHQLEIPGAERSGMEQSDRRSDVHSDWNEQSGGGDVDRMYNKAHDESEIRQSPSSSSPGRQLAAEQSEQQQPSSHLRQLDDLELMPPAGLASPLRFPPGGGGGIVANFKTLDHKGLAVTPSQDAAL